MKFIYQLRASGVFICLAFAVHKLTWIKSNQIKDNRGEGAPSHIPTFRPRSSRNNAPIQSHCSRTNCASTILILVAKKQPPSVNVPTMFRHRCNRRHRQLLELSHQLQAIRLGKPRKHLFPCGIVISDAGDILLGDSRLNRFQFVLFARERFAVEVWLSLRKVMNSD